MKDVEINQHDALRDAMSVLYRIATGGPDVGSDGTIRRDHEIQAAEALAKLALAWESSPLLMVDRDLTFTARKP